jgi:hypothetical protein
MKLNTQTLQTFCDLVTRASRARSRDVRIDIADAVALSTELTLLIARLAAYETPAVAEHIVAIKVDGGGF